MPGPSNRKYASRLTDNIRALSPEAIEVIDHVYGRWDGPRSTTLRRPKVSVYGEAFASPTGEAAAAGQRVIRDLVRLGFAPIVSAAPAPLGTVDAHARATGRAQERRATIIRNRPSSYLWTPSGDPRLIDVTENTSRQTVMRWSHLHLFLGLPIGEGKGLGTQREWGDIGEELGKMHVPPAPVVVLYPASDPRRADVVRNAVLGMQRAGLSATAVSSDHPELAASFCIEFWRNFRGIHFEENVTESLERKTILRHSWFVVKNRPTDGEMKALAYLQSPAGAPRFPDGVRHWREIPDGHLLFGTWAGSYADSRELIVAVNMLDSAPDDFERLDLSRGLNSIGPGSRHFGEELFREP